MADTAYTNLALDAHTDTTYFSDPAGLQAFHVLSHTPDSPADSGPLGGESLLVDGFRAARALRDGYPQAYEVLSAVGLPWHASGNEGIAISPDRMYPVLEKGVGGEVGRVRWNNDDRGGVPGGFSVAEQEAWFKAARLWVEALREGEYWVQLEPGTVLSMFLDSLDGWGCWLTRGTVFDNWRVLHGRSAFTGKRRVCGGYSKFDPPFSQVEAELIWLVQSAETTGCRAGGCRTSVLRKRGARRWDTKGVVSLCGVLCV